MSWNGCQSRLGFGRGIPIGTDGILLGNPSDLTNSEEVTNRLLAAQWNDRRWRLAEHLKVWKSVGNIKSTI